MGSAFQLVSDMNPPDDDRVAGQYMQVDVTAGWHFKFDPQRSRQR